MIKELLLSSAILAATLSASAADYTLPFEFAMNSQAQLNECTVIANEPSRGGNTWSYDSSKSAFKCMYDYYDASDDWVITPAVDFGNTNKIKLSIDARKQTSNGQASFEVRLGRSADPDQMTVTALNAASSDMNSSFKTLESVINTEGGVWYIGIRCTSEKFSAELYVRNLKIESLGEATEDPEIPEMPDHLYIVGELDGYSFNPARGQELTRDGDTFTGVVNFDYINSQCNFWFAANLAETNEEFNVVGNVFTPDITTNVSIDETPVPFIVCKDFENQPKFVTSKGTYKVTVDWEAMTVKLSKDTGVEGIAVSEDVEIQWYNLQGQRVDNPSNGVFIRVIGNNAEKVML